MSNKLFIISGPGGSGKTTLATMITEAMPNVVRSISTTTRAPRPGEEDGVDYRFVTDKVFQEKMEVGAFIECARVFDSWYGSEKNHIFNALNQGKHVILVIDVGGALEVKKQLETVSIFISPPSLEVLEERLKRRKAEEKELKNRLEAAHAEMQMIDHYDYHLINSDLEKAFERLKEIFIQEGEKS